MKEKTKVRWPLALVKEAGEEVEAPALFMYSISMLQTLPQTVGMALRPLSFVLRLSAPGYMPRKSARVAQLGNSICDPQILFF